MAPARPPLVLASASPRRVEILGRLGLEFEVVPSGVDESAFAALPPRRQVLDAAVAKARAVARRRPSAWVVASDTTVALDGKSLGKPSDRADAARMLRLLAGRTHSVLSAVVLAFPGGEVAGLGISRVRFDRLSDAQVRRYVAGGEPDDKAGAYAIQGDAAAFATVVRGRPDTVVGLPAHVLARLLRQAQAAGTGVPLGIRTSANLGRLR